jgi:hypothetical protein
VKLKPPVARYLLDLQRQRDAIDAQINSAIGVLALQLGIDLATVQSIGPDGQIVFREKEPADISGDAVSGTSHRSGAS